MAKYIYNGPVTGFNRCFCEHWKAETTAMSEAKARSNLTYQFKKQNHLIPGTRVTLPGKLEKIGG